MKLHYFNQDKADEDDLGLKLAIKQGYVPKTCLLGSVTLMSEVLQGRSPCWGCRGPREKCHGQPQRE